MSATSKPQYARVEQPFGCDYTTIHCPICGKAPNDEEGDPEAEFTPCKHLAFLYSTETGKIEYCTDDFKKRTGALENELSICDFEEYLKKAGYDNKLLIIEFTQGGMACGPAYTTEVYGFDFGAIATH